MTAERENVHQNHASIHRSGIARDSESGRPGPAEPQRLSDAESPDCTETSLEPGASLAARSRTAGLGPLGLSPVEERVYRQVIASGAGSARGTARLLRLPPMEVEQALARLQALRLISRSNAESLSYVPGQGLAASGSREVEYVPEPPTESLGALLQTHAANLASR